MNYEELIKSKNKKHIWLRTAYGGHLLKTYKNIKDFRIYNKTLTFKIKDEKFRMKISSADVDESYYGNSPIYINVYVSANREVLLNFQKKYYKKEYKRMYENKIKEIEENIDKFLEEIIKGW